MMNPAGPERYAFVTAQIDLVAMPQNWMVDSKGDWRRTGVPFGGYGAPPRIASHHPQKYFFSFPLNALHAIREFRRSFFPPPALLCNQERDD